MPRIRLNKKSSRNQRILTALSQAEVQQAKLASRLGVTTSAVSQKLNHATDVNDINLVAAVSELTGVPFDYLCFGDLQPVSIKPLNQLPETKQSPIMEKFISSNVEGREALLLRTYSMLEPEIQVSFFHLLVKELAKQL